MNNITNSELIKIEKINNFYYTTSLNIAEVFDISHEEVLLIIRSILKKWNQIKSDRFCLTNYFIHTRIKENERVYLITKKGTARIIMPLNGINSEKAKFDFIERFEILELQDKQTR